MAMSAPAQSTTVVVFRVVTPGQPAFRLRKREEGISVFDPSAVDPPLAETEILDCFRPGCEIVECSVAAIEQHGMQLVAVEGANVLPGRLRQAHREIRPGPQMSRAQFKTALQELES